MAIKYRKPEEIVARLRQVEVLVGQGKAVVEAVRAIGVTEATYHRWRAKYGGLKLDQVRRLKQLEQENSRLHECLAIRVGRRLGSADVIDTLADLFITRGTPGYIRSDNGPEFAAVAVKGWITGVRASTAFIEPASPWENGYVESFNGKLRDELLGCEVFNSLAEARVLIEQWRKHCSTVRPHSSLGHRPPAPEVVLTAPLMMPSIPGPIGSAPSRPAMH